MQEALESILEKYGTRMILLHDGVTRQVRGFFQPVRSESWQNMLETVTPLGEIIRGQYVYIGHADDPVFEGDTLEVGGKHYIFRRVEPYYYGDAAVYFWGLCVEKGVNDTWGAQS